MASIVRGAMTHGFMVVQAGGCMIPGDGTRGTVLGATIGG